jgi:hypothetical protein
LPALAGLALLTCSNLRATLACVGCVTLVAAVLLWRGEEYAHGVRIGVAAGIAPLLLPLLAQSSGHWCTTTLCLFMPGICLASGVVGGLVLGVFSGGMTPPSHRFWWSAIVVTALIGSVGCLLAGLAGIAGMALGLVAGATPLLVVRTA